MFFIQFRPKMGSLRDADTGASQLIERKFRRRFWMTGMSVRTHDTQSNRV